MKKYVFLISIIFFSCNAAQRVADKYNEQISTLLYKANKEDIAGWIGIPQNTQTIGTSEYWYYHISYGTKSNASANVWTGKNYGFGNAYGNTWERYDDLTFVFNEKGTLINFTCRIQR